jgi:hypothetical protein
VLDPNLKMNTKQNLYIYKYKFSFSYLQKKLKVVFADDGTFWMEWSDFIREYNNFQVVRLLQDKVTNVFLNEIKIAEAEKQKNLAKRNKQNTNFVFFLLLIEGRKTMA